MDPLDPSRRRDITPDVHDLHDEAALPAAPSSTHPAGPASVPPDLPDVDAAVLRRAIHAATHARAPDAATTDKPAADVAIQRHLDGFRAAATPTYHTPEGDVIVPTPFRMAKDPAVLQDDSALGGIYARQERSVEANREALLKVGRSVGVAPRDVLLVQLGRGSPASVHRLTQALIDQGHLPAKVVSPFEPPRVSTDLPSRVKDMMTRYGIGLDGPGYARQALDPASRGFSRVALEDARPGDVLALDGAERAVVYDRREATASEKAAVVVATGRAAAETGPVTAWVVDGARRPRWAGLPDGGVGLVGGGVERRTLLHDETTGQWVSRDERGTLRASPAPFGEGLQGVYRPASSPPHSS
jgi:hypothetical protein